LHSAVFFAISDSITVFQAFDIPDRLCDIANMGKNEWVYNQYKHCIRVRIVCGEKVDMYSSGQLIVNPQHYIEPDLSAAGNDTEVNIERRSGNLIKRTCFVN